MMTEQEVYEILKNNSNVMDYGEHEWDNSWLREIPVMTKRLNEYGDRLIGWFPLSTPAYCCGIKQDIGIVAERQDGTRYWCHFMSDMIESFIEEYEEERNESDNKC